MDRLVARALFETGCYRCGSKKARFGLCAVYARNRRSPPMQRLGHSAI